VVQLCHGVDAPGPGATGLGNATAAIFLGPGGGIAVTSGVGAGVVAGVEHLRAPQLQGGQPIVGGEIASPLPGCRGGSCHRVGKGTGVNPGL